MPTINVKMLDGTERQIEGESGDSIMDVLRGNDIPGVVALCGGCCSCATCHVYVAADWFDRLEPRSDNENDLLEFSEHYRDNSRLSCQIALIDDLDGIFVEVAPED